MATMTTTRAPAKGVSLRSAWKFVQKSDPALVATWLAALEAYERSEPDYQARAAKFQRDRNIPRQRPTSPEAEALEIAAAALSARIEDLIRSGKIVFAGFPAGQLDGNPVAIPIAALGRRRPSGPWFIVRGADFYQVKLYLAEDLVGAKPDPA